MERKQGASSGARDAADDDWQSCTRAPDRLDQDSPEWSQFSSLCETLGLEHFVVVYRLVLPEGPPMQVALSNWPEVWWSRYWAQGYIRIDPLFAHVLLSYAPFPWTELPAPSPLQTAYLEDAAEHGFVDGISGKVKFGSDEVGLFTMSSDRPLDPAIVEKAMAYMHLRTAQAFGSVRERVLASLNIRSVRLTPLQLAALSGILTGLTMKQLSAEMEISISAVTSHLRAARRKLGERNNKAAVRKAVALNLLSPYRQGAGTGKRTKASK